MKMYSTNSREHPLPAPPGQTQNDQRPQQRNRAQSSFTIKSHKSSGSGGKQDLHETHAEKKHLTTHADPSMAMTELEPSAVARQQSSLAPIRAIQHRDHLGNPIGEYGISTIQSIANSVKLIPTVQILRVTDGKDLSTLFDPSKQQLMETIASHT